MEIASNYSLSVSPRNPSGGLQFDPISATQSAISRLDAATRWSSSPTPSARHREPGIESRSRATCAAKARPPEPKYLLLCRAPVLFWYATRLMRFLHTLTFVVALVVSVFARDKKLDPVAERISAQNVVFEEQYESDLHEFPERATDLGDYRYNDKLADHSLAAALRREKINEGFLARLRAISSEGFSDQDQLSHDLLVRGLEQRIVDFELKEYEMPINQFNGVHTTLADLPNSVPLDSLKHYDDYVARLHQIPRVLLQTTEVLRAGMKDNLMPVRFLLEKIPAQCQGIIDAN